MVLKLKWNNFYCYKSPIFLKDVNIEKVLVSNKISCGEENYKYLFGYLHNDHKVKSLHMFPKRNAYVKVLMDQVNGRNFDCKWCFIGKI